MGKIETYRSENAVYHEGQPNMVLSVTECKHYALRVTDAAGKETMCLVVAFGKMEDGGLGVFRLASATQMAEQLQRMPENQLEQIRAAIADYKEASVGDSVKLNPDVAKALDEFEPEEAAAQAVAP